jgi:hypothetical protein
MVAQMRLLRSLEGKMTNERGRERERERERITNGRTGQNL